MRHLGLFAGFGGFELAARWAGWETVAWCEWNEFCQKVLKYHFPDAVGHSDITKTDFTVYANQIDVLTGGFPCQPYSLAGQRKGTEDERHLWPEMLRAIREIRPPWVVGENVRGIVSWNAGLVFEQVQADLEAEGYEVLTFILPAAGVNAPHQRERVWFVAYSSSNADFGVGRHLCRHATCEWHKREKYGISSNIGSNGDFANATCERCNNGCDNREKRCIQANFGSSEEGEPEWNRWQCWTCEVSSITPNPSIQRREERQQDERWANAEKNATGLEYESQRFSSEWNTTDTSLRNDWECIREQEAGQEQQSGIGFEQDINANTCNQGLQGFKKYRSIRSIRKNGEEQFTGYVSPDWSKFPTQPPICGGDDGISAELDGITFSKWRTESIKGYGNAIVPQVALRIFNVINEMMKND